MKEIKSQKEMEVLAKSAYEIKRADGKITRICRSDGGKRKEYVYTPKSKKGG